MNLLKKFKIESTYERKWIQDKNYVDPQDIPNSELNRYEAFRSYLKMICNETRIYWKLVEFTANGLQVSQLNFLNAFISSHFKN